MKNKPTYTDFRDAKPENAAMAMMLATVVGEATSKLDVLVNLSYAKDPKFAAMILSGVVASICSHITPDIDSALALLADVHADAKKNLERLDGILSKGGN